MATDPTQMPLGYPEGTLVSAGEPNHYLYRGKSAWYLISLQHRACSCPSFFWRRKCRHIEAVEQALKQRGDLS